MSNGILSVTLWDVGHGVSIWIMTPNGHQHWIDLGKTSEFSPSLHVRQTHAVRAIDYLIISHPDQDLIEDLPNFRSVFGDPRILLRNKSLPHHEMFGEGRRQYQIDFRGLHERFMGDIASHESPTNPAYNGGVEYASAFLGIRYACTRSDPSWWSAYRRKQYFCSSYAFLRGSTDKCAQEI